MNDSMVANTQIINKQDLGSRKIANAMKIFGDKKSRYLLCDVDDFDIHAISWRNTIPSEIMPGCILIDTSNLHPTIAIHSHSHLQHLAYDEA